MSSTPTMSTGQKLDWAAAVLLFALGVGIFIYEWPTPGVWAWSSLVLGVVGLPMAYFNVMEHLKTWALRKLLVRRH